MTTTKRSKWLAPNHKSHGDKPKPKPNLGKSNPYPQQVHLHEKDNPTEDQIPETPTQAVVHECLTECGTDSSGIQNVMSVFNAKGGIASQDSQENFNFT